MKTIAFSLFLFAFYSCSNTDSQTKTDTSEITKTTKTTVDSNTDQDTLAQYEYIRAKYESFEWGDLPHFGFKSASGEMLDVNMIKDEIIKDLTVYDEASNSEIINTKLKGKTFDLYYKVESHDLMDWGEPMEIPVVYIMKMVK